MELPAIRVAVVVLVACLVAGGYAKRGFGGTEQEWGYVTVRPYAHMFWWLYYTTAKVPNYYEKPLLIWLQGGPGASSTGYGNFEELGPLDLELNERNYTWVKNYNVLFIDNPVGSGYSYVERYPGYPETNEQIAADLLECIRGFYKTVPKFTTVPVYITAESYGGKMAVEFAKVWYKAQKSGSIDSNLKGVAMGDSWISPIDSVLTWAPFLLQTGMVDTEGYNRIVQSAETTRMAVESEKWAQATDLWARTEQVILDATDNVDFYNILYKTQPRRSSLVSKKANAPLNRDVVYNELVGNRDFLLDQLMNSKVRDALGVNATWGEGSSAVFSTLYADFMKPVIDQVEILLNQTDLNVLVFTGQLDLIVDTPGTLLWVERMNWKDKAGWKIAPRIPVVVNNSIEGYVKEYNNFKMYWINRSGHMVPRDNPSATEYMLNDLTSSNANQSDSK